MMNAKTLLITGANGFIGHSVCQYFHMKGYKIIAVVRESNLDSFQRENKFYEIIIESFNNFVSTIQKGLITYKPNAVIHCAGSSSVFKSFEEPYKDFESTVNTVSNCLENIRLYSPETKFVFISSASVYGNPLIIPIHENDPIQPISPYGTHKLIAETLITEYSKFFNVNSTILRVFSAYGNFNATGLKKQIVFDLFNKFLDANQQDNIVLFGTGNETRDFIHIQDILSAIELVVTKEISGIYNLASGTQTSIQQLALLVRDILKLQAKKITFTNEVRLGDPMYWEANISELQQYNFKCKVSLENGLQQYSQWFFKYFQK